MYPGPQRQIRFRTLQAGTEDADEESPEVPVQEQVPQLSRQQAEIQNRIVYGDKDGW